jgi:hypothetical protein
VLLQLGLQALEERQGVGGGARKAHDDLAVIEPPDLFGMVFHHHVAQSHLAVAGHRHLIAPAHHEDGGAAEFLIINHSVELLTSRANRPGGKGQKGKRRKG